MLIDSKNYVINRDDAVIRNFDRVYCDLVDKIINKGERVENRTGIDCFSVEGEYFKLDVGDCFPILEVKKVNIKNALSELLWIYQAQSNDVSWLHQRGNHIWDEWAIKDDGYWYASQNVSDNNGGYKLESVKKYFGKDYAGTIGTAYGFINNKFKRPQYVLNQLKNNPHDRRMVISLWQDEYMSTAVLPSCVWNSEWKVMNNRLHVFVHQRSCDVALGLPFNVSQYAILLCMFATVSGLKIGNLNWSIMDAHIYENQIEQMKLLLKRFRLMEKWEQVIKENSDKEIQFIYDNLLDNITKNSSKELLEDKLILELMIMKKKPFLTLASLDDFFAFDNSEDNKDIKLSDYVSAPFIAMPIAQ